MFFTDARIKIRKIDFRYTLDVYRSQSYKIHFGCPEEKFARFTLDI